MGRGTVGSVEDGPVRRGFDSRWGLKMAKADGEVSGRKDV